MKKMSTIYALKDQEQTQTVNTILKDHEYDSSKLIPILHRIQEKYNYLPRDMLFYIAEHLNLPGAHIFGVATFYTHYSLVPKGKYVIRLCDGTACHVRGSLAILEALYEQLSLNEKKVTTPDMLFTVETVSCLGACGLAPVMVVNDKVYGLMTPEKATKLVETIKNQELKNMNKVKPDVTDQQHA
jgi:NADH-quinone oxidoreductase subunit E